MLQRRALLVAALIAFSLCSANAKVKDVKIRGYVTNVVSPTEFEIEDYRITREGSLILDFENASPELKFRPEDIRVGVELEIKGSFNDQTNELKAKSISVDLEQFKKHKQTAVLSKSPEGVEHTHEGWTGTFFVDGQRIQVTPRTQVVFQMTEREKNAAKKDRSTEDAEFRPLASLDDVSTGMQMTYEGARSIQDGSITAERVEFSHNELTNGEKKMWDSLKTESKPFNAAALAPGELKVSGVGKFKTVPDQDVQDYVSALGNKLIPAYQRELPESDPVKIPFRFYVVSDKVPNAFALPNGIVVINSGLFNIVENEAQFSAVVGHEIAHAVQRHTYRQQQYHKNVKLGLAIGAAVAAGFGQYGLRDIASMTLGAIQNGYQRNLENQSDRLGLEYMVYAGYDPREAPRVWKLMAQKLGDAPTNFFWSSHDNASTRRSYLMNELKNNYSGLDYTALKTNEEAFRAIAEKVKAAAEGKRRIKVTH